LLHGAPSWFETLTTDVPSAVKFYSGLFGWEPEAVPVPGIEYTVFKLAGTHIAGAMKFIPRIVDQRPRWITYFTVNDVDAVAKQTTELGGSVSVPPEEIPGIGRYCGITSPQGVAFFVITYAK
jgi:predicted enzyme related to lactoylglutathione lyase